MSTTALAPQTPAADRSQCFLAQLVLRCGRGDEAALGDLFDLTFFFVAGNLALRPLSSSGVDDEIIDAFRRIWSRSRDYRPREHDALSWVLDQALDAQEPTP